MWWWTQKRYRVCHGSIIPDVLTYTTTVDSISGVGAWFPEDAGTSFSSQTEQKRNVFRGSLNWYATDQDEIYLDSSYSKDDRVENSYFSNFNRLATSYYGEGEKLTWHKKGCVRAGIGGVWCQLFLRNRWSGWRQPSPNGDAAVSSRHNHTVDAKFVVDQFESQILSLGAQVSYTSAENERDYSSFRQ